jgi:hypothetical protein
MDQKIMKIIMDREKNIIKRLIMLKEIEFQQEKGAFEVHKII